MPHHPPRRWFLRTAGLVLAVPLPAAIVSMVNRFTASLRRARTIVVPGNAGDAVTFADGVIVTREDGAVRAFSATCTHLGCLIDRADGDELVCPCHGSRFRLDGSVATGPAIRPLEPLAHETDAETGDVTVHAT